MAQALYDIITGINKQIKSICCKINILETALENCGGGNSSCSYSRNIDVTYPATTGIVFQLAGSLCDGGMTEFNYVNLMLDNIPAINNINDLVQMLNENLSFYGTFSVTGPTEVTIELSSHFSFVCSCDQAGVPFFFISNN